MLPYKAKKALRTLRAWSDSDFVRAASGEDGERLKSALEGALDEAIDHCESYRRAILDAIRNAGDDSEFRMALAIREAAVKDHRE